MAADLVRFVGWLGCLLMGHNYQQCECCGETSCVHCGLPEDVQ